MQTKGTKDIWSLVCPTTDGPRSFNWKTKAALPYHGWFEGLPDTFTESYLSDLKPMHMHESYLVCTSLKMTVHALDRNSLN